MQASVLSRNKHLFYQVCVCVGLTLGFLERTTRENTSRQRPQQLLNIHMLEALVSFLKELLANLSGTSSDSFHRPNAGTESGICFQDVDVSLGSV